MSEEIPIVFNGVEEKVKAQPQEQVMALLQRALQTFKVTQQPHLYSLFRTDGTKVPENESVQAAGLNEKTILYLRQDSVKGGGA
jgi:hypothetical protein